MRIYKVLLCFFVVQISCNQTNSEKKYYSSGELFSQIEYDKNGNRNGITKKYFENGNLMQISIYKEGELMDTTFVFHENGNKRSVIIFKSDTVYSQEFYKDEVLKGVGKFLKKSKAKLGWWKYYDDNGNLQQELEYVKNNNEPNQFIAYDTKQNIIRSQSYYYSIKTPEIAKMKTDSLIEITYSSPYKENSEIYIVLEKSKDGTIYKDSVRMLYNPASVNLSFDKLGSKRFKGYFLEKYGTKYEELRNDSIIRKERRMYFDEKTIVLEN